MATIHIKTSKSDAILAGSQGAAALASYCFEARTRAHQLHLQQQGPGSDARHRALGAFYNGIIDLVDGYVESYQGRYGVITSYPESNRYVGLDATTLIQRLREDIDEIRAQCGTYSELQNDIDGIVTLCNHTIYKLVNLS